MVVANREEEATVGVEKAWTAITPDMENTESDQIEDTKDDTSDAWW